VVHREKGRRRRRRTRRTRRRTRRRIRRGNLNEDERTSKRASEQGDERHNTKGGFVQYPRGNERKGRTFLFLARGRPQHLNGYDNKKWVLRNHRKRPRKESTHRKPYLSRRKPRLLIFGSGDQTPVLVGLCGIVMVEDIIPLAD
jgi:hypothetical protein